MRKGLCGLAIAAVLTAWCFAADVANMSGTWNLNVAKSTWGKKVQPLSVVIKIDHNEPKLHYTGSAKVPDSDERTFEFDGAVDGKEYPTVSAYGPAKVAYKRVNPYTTSSVLKSDDGKFTETATTVIDRDGKTLTRRMQMAGPDGRSVWTEIYSKQ